MVAPIWRTKYPRALICRILNKMKATANLTNISSWIGRCITLIVVILVAACGGGGGGGGGSTQGTSSTGTGTSTNTSQTNNIVQIVLDGGLPSSQRFNSPFVSVTVCQPGTTNCQTIDHVLVDTGSWGLRLMQSVLNTNLNLPIVTDYGVKPLGECAVFGTLTTWGSVQRADVKLGGETASNIPINVIGGAPAGYTAVPSDCSGTGKIADTPALLRGNGILGVGLFATDCPVCTSYAAPTTYYSCTATSCTATTLPAANIVANPASAFSQDNNGVVITLPAVGDAGATNLAGTLIFGIGTQSNNQLGNATVFPITDAFVTGGTVQTAFNGVTMNSFIDSGSTANYFHDPAIPLCSSTTIYCPTSTLNFSAIISSTSAVAKMVNFSVVNPQNFSGNMTAGNIAVDSGNYGSIASEFDWGMPFFFGRTVFTAIADASTPYGNGPYWAFTGGATPTCSGATPNGTYPNCHS